MASLLSRREFTLLTGAAAGVAAAPLRAARRDVSIGLQLYSLRNECKADLPGTLAAVGKLGFHGVEWYGWGGYFDRTPKDLKKLLDDNGLKSASDHIHGPMLDGDRFQQTLDLHQTLGTKLLVLSELLGNREQRTTAKFWEDGARKMNDWAAKLRPQGIRLGLHNHAVEFQKLDDGRLPWEIVYDHTNPVIAQQLDLAGVVAGGFDPVTYIRKYPGRTLAMHMKDYSAEKKGILIGEGIMRWQELFNAAEDVGGVEWYLVEQETYPFPPLESVEKSLANLRELLARRNR